MFSKRTGWPREKNALSKASAMGPRFDLTVSNPTAVDLPVDRSSLLSSLADPGGALYRPEPFGHIEARRAVSDYYGRRGRPVSLESVMLVATTSEAYAFLFRLLADPGQGIAVSTPSYPLLHFLADVSDVRVLTYLQRFDPRRGRWSIDFESLESALDEGARAVVVVSPNNPTGTTPDANERRRLLDLSARRGVPLIVDEVFLDFLDEPSRFEDLSFAGESATLCFTLSGLSKVAGLPQLKASWIVSSGPRELVDEARARLDLLGDTFLSLATPVQLAMPAILAGADEWQTALRRRISANLESLSDALSGSPLSIRPRDGGWYAILELPEGIDDEVFSVELLEREGVLIHPGYLFDTEEQNLLVASLIGRAEEMTQAARLLRARFVE